MPRPAGVPNKNFPPRPLADALRVPTVIQEEASGMAVSRLTLAQLLGTTPSSSVFRDLILSSRAYGLSTGGKNAEEFGLTPTGERATGLDEVERVAALKAAVMNVAPFKAFFHTFANKKVPGTTAAREFLTKHARVHETHAEACMAQILADAETAGLTRTIGNAPWVDLTGAPAEPRPDGEGEDGDEVPPWETGPDEDSEAPAANTASHRGGNGNGSGKLDRATVTDPAPPQAIFVGGRKTKSLEQVVAILTEYKIPHRVTEFGANRGRPISQKVADTMRECGAAILVFTPDEELRDTEGNPVWRPTDNVVHELGAAGILYGNRIVIFREERVTLASNYSDIGHIVFKEGELDAKAVELFRELIAFGLVKVTVGV